MQFEEKSRLVAKGNGVMTPEQAAQIGTACSYVSQRKRLLVGHSGEKGAAALAHAFSSGAAAAGSEVILAGECAAPATSYAGTMLGCTLTAFVHTEITSVIQLYDREGMGLFRSTEERILSAAGHAKSLPYAHFGRITAFDSADKLYAAKMRETVKGELHGIFADICSPSSSVIKVCDEILLGKNDKNGTRIAFHISGNSGRSSAYTEETGYVNEDRLILLCQRDRLSRGESIAVCGKPSMALEGLAKEYGGKILSCGRNICISDKEPSKECIEARTLAAEQGFLHDGIALAAEVLELLRRRNITLAEAVSELPPQAVISRYIPADKPSELLRRLCATGCTEDGVLADSPAGRVSIRPVRTGKGIILGVESYALEAAEELCGFYADIISGAMRY